VSESGDGGTSLESGITAKQLRSQYVYPGLRKAAATYMALAGRYPPRQAPLYRGCLLCG
jgi:hypothetical protein